MSNKSRVGFTLIELLVVIAIIAVLIALLVPAVQRVRESANRTMCGNNLRQLSLAIVQFHDNNKVMPPWFGQYPPHSNGSSSRQSPFNRAYGGWFLHILPYVEQQPLFNQYMEQINADMQNQYVNTQTGTGTPSTGTQTNTYTVSGVTYTVEVGTGGTSNTYDTTNYGIWLPEYKHQYFAILRCPSDPSSFPGEIFRDWAMTSYVANWNALSDSRGDGTANQGVWSTNPRGGVFSGPQPFRRITDGNSNTIVFGEAYSQCENQPRRALHSWGYHNFGLTPGLASGWTISAGGLIDPAVYATAPSQGFDHGLPNTFLPQIKPTFRRTSCTNDNCCQFWRTQTPHDVIQTAFLDASVRRVNPAVSQNTWTLLMLPRDGQTIPEDWQ